MGRDTRRAVGKKVFGEATPSRRTFGYGFAFGKDSRDDPNEFCGWKLDNVNE